MAVPYTFATATSSIPLSQLDSNFATGITLGNTTVYLGNTTTSIGNLTLTNATISSVATTFPNSFLANSSVTIGSTNISLGGTSTTLAGLTGVTSSAITDSGLTSGRVTFAGTGGLLSDSANLFWDNTNARLGIGTSSPSEKLVVNGGTSTSQIRWNVSNSTYVEEVSTNAAANAYVYKSYDASYHVWKLSSSEAMRISSSGNVGIGTSSPSDKLDVNGNMRISGAGYFSIYNADNTTYSQIRDSGGAYVSQMEFYTAGAERMRIDNSGNLLVGTTITSNSNGLLLGKGGAAGGGIIIVTKTATGATQSLLNYYGTTYVGGINYDNTSTSFPTSSDLRLKKDIINAPSAINKINNIHIVSHGWKHDDAIVEYGVIAQELINVAPQAVTKGDDNEEIELTWTVDYSKLVPMLTKAIQEQQALIESLTQRIATLENK